MQADYLNKLFNMNHKVIVITGGAGYLCSTMAEAFISVRLCSHNCGL